MPHPQQVLALQQCSPASLWQAPSTSCGHSVSVHPSTSVPVLRLASSSAVRTHGCNSSSERFRVSLRCRSVSKSQTGRNMEELEVYLLAFSS